MKKILLGFAFLGLTAGASAQVLLSEDFNSMTIGNIGTDLTGVTAGQNGWFTGNAAGGTNGANSNYQVVLSSTGSNALQITGSNAGTGTRFMWKDGLPTAWAARTAGNNIIEVEFDFNPSVASTSLNGFRVYIYSDETTAKVLAGMGVASNANVGTPAVSYANVVNGFGYWTSTPGTGTYSFGLGPNNNTPVTLAADTWVRLGFSFNKTTGEIKWKGPGIDSSFTGNAAGGFPVVTAGIDPGEIDFLGTTATGNTVADVGFFDNLVVRASATDTLLGLEELGHTNPIAIFPNPAKDMVNIAALDTTIKNVVMTDINGRIVRNINNDSGEAQINVSDLAPGVYVLKVTSSEGNVTTKKLVKE